MGSAIFVAFKMTNLLAQNVFYSILAYVMKFNLNFFEASELKHEKMLYHTLIYPSYKPVIPIRFIFNKTCL
jgi:hypothetical protein